MNLRKFGLFLLLFAAIACSSAKHYTLKGQILAVNRDKQELLVKHEEIVGYMMAMTMPYKVESAAMLENLSSGDLIEADLAVTDNVGVLMSIKKTGTAQPELPPPSPVAQSGFELIKDGEAIPNQAFLDENGKARTFNDIAAGHVVALTFMYTKCPMPTFCPMMDRNFVEVQKQIKADAGLREKARLISVSFDPKNDTPPVLLAHAKGLKADPAIWTFVTGERDDIDKFAMRFGLQLIRGAAPNPDEIGHTLRTAIVGRDGKLVKSYTGNEWTPAQVVADLQQLP